MFTGRTLHRWYEEGIKDATERGHPDCGFPSNTDMTVYRAMRDAGFREGQRRIAALAKQIREASDD